MQMLGPAITPLVITSFTKYKALLVQDSFVDRRVPQHLQAVATLETPGVLFDKVQAVLGVGGEDNIAQRKTLCIPTQQMLLAEMSLQLRVAPEIFDFSPHSNSLPALSSPRTQRRITVL